MTPMPSVKSPPAFSIHQRVWITELVCWGRVMALYTDAASVQFNVRYFYNGDAKTVYFYADELAAVKP